MSAVAIAGRSGEGKSTSIGGIPELNISGLDPKSTFIINVAGKDLPFKGWKKNYTPWTAANPNGNLLNTSDPTTIAKTINHINSNMKHITDVLHIRVNVINSFSNS